MTVQTKVVKEKAFEERLHRQENPIKTYLKKALLYLPLIIWTFVVFFPFWYMLVLSTKGKAEIFNYPPPLTMSKDFYKGFLENYHNLLAQLPFWRNMWNSIYIAVMSTLTSMFFCSLGGYGFAVYEFKGKKFMFNFMLFTMMIPGIVGIVPYFVMMNFLGWLNKARALYIPGMANAFGIFLMRQYINSSVSLDLIDAARVDGASEFGIYWRIVLPLISPILGSYAIVTFLGSWNSYMGPLIVLRTMESYTVPVALNALKGLQSVDYGAIMVGNVISVFPMLIVYAIFSKMIINKVTEGALKA
ncbi:MAG: carbohydrate ABC transporter permease [Brevinematia bacterium]